MLDTVHFYIDNPVVDAVSGATRYHELIEHVTKKAANRQSKFSYREQFQAGVSLTVVNGTFYDDTGTLYFHNDNLKVKSSSSELVFCANYAKERIEINVSVPKFMAGNNVYYLLDFADFQNFDKNARAVYKITKFYIRKILDDLTDRHFHLHVLAEHVTLERIDLCYNLLCKDNAEVTRRIQACNQLNLTRQTDKTVTVLYQDETFTCSSSLGWYFKVYNKQKEFKRNDFNKIKKYSPEKADFILKQSARICRFELGIRSNFMDYLFWNKLFWKDSPDADIYKRYKRWRVDPPALAKEKNKAGELLTKEQIKKNTADYSTYKYYRQEFMPFTFKAMSFHMGDHNNNPVWYENEFTPGFGFKWNTQLLNNRKSFDYHILNECWLKFHELLFCYNPDFKDVKRQVEGYKSNSSLDFLVVQYLKKGYSLDECKTKFNISRQTVHNIKKRFKKKGVDVNMKSIHQLQDEYKPISLIYYYHFIPINNMMILQPELFAEKVQAKNIKSRFG